MLELAVSAWGINLRRNDYGADTSKHMPAEQRCKTALPCFQASETRAFFNRHSVSSQTPARSAFQSPLPPVLVKTRALKNSRRTTRGAEAVGKQRKNGRRSSQGTPDPPVRTHGPEVLMAGSVRAPPRRQARPLRRNKRCASASEPAALVTATPAPAEPAPAPEPAARRRPRPRRWRPSRRRRRRRPGSRITVRFSDGRDYGGTITELLDGHRAMVLYDDGQSEAVRFPDSDVRVTRVGPAPSLEVTLSTPAAAPVPAAAAPADAEQSFEDGDRVEARFGFGKQWYGGRITGGSALIGYDVVYDDGDRESGVAAELIRPIIREFVEMPPEPPPPAVEPAGEDDFVGIYRKSKTANWEAGIKVNGERMHLGTYDCPEAAARAYDEGPRPRPPRELPARRRAAGEEAAEAREDALNPAHHRLPEEEEEHLAGAGHFVRRLPAARWRGGRRWLRGHLAWRFMKVSAIIPGLRGSRRGNQASPSPARRSTSGPSPTPSRRPRPTTRRRGAGPPR